MGISFKTFFVGTKDINHTIILGTPFIDMTFTSKFPNKIIDKTQLQRFLGSLNYVLDYYLNISRLAKPLYDRLKTNLIPWFDLHTDLVKQIKKQVQTIPLLHLASWAGVFCICFSNLVSCLPMVWRLVFVKLFCWMMCLVFVRVSLPGNLYGVASTV